MLFALFSTQNPENLLLFAAGNYGDINDGRKCTIGFGAIGKNSLAIGSTSSGKTRLTTTGADGNSANDSNGYANVDTVSAFSSYGLTWDNRIKPEILSPGDAVSSLRPYRKCH